MKFETVSRFLLAMLLSALALLPSLAHAEDQVRGTWVARWQVNDDLLNLQIIAGKKESVFGQHYKIGELKGLTVQAVNGAKTPVHFQLLRDAGTIDFDGFFDRGVGSGQFSFIPSPSYMRELSALGFSCVGQKQFDMAAIDVSLSYAKEYKELGLEPSCDKLIEGRIFNVNRQQVEELRALGYDHLSLDKLVELRIFEVDGAYIRQMRAQGMDLSLDKLVESKVFKVSPESKKEFADLGYPDLSQEDLVTFKIHEVTPAYIREMRSLGFNNLSAKQLEEFRIFGIDRQQIEELKSVGYKDLDPRDLVAFKIHDVDADFIRKVQKYGYKHPSPEKLVNMKIHGIRVHDKDDDGEL
jgi:hypothetical protein